MQKKRMRKTIGLTNAAKWCEIHLLDKKDWWKSQWSTQKALFLSEIDTLKMAQVWRNQVTII